MRSHVPRCHRRREEHGGRLEVRLHRAAVAARRRPEAGLPFAHGLREDFLRERIVRMDLLGKRVGVLLLRHDRQVRRDDRDAQRIARLLGQEFGCARFGRRHQHAGVGAGRVLEVIVAAVDADEHLRLLVVRLEILVGDRPVGAEAVARLRLEVVLAHAERDASPVVRASAEHAGTPPEEVAAGCGRIGLARYLPPTVDRGVVEAERLLLVARAAQRGFAREVEHRGLALGVVVASGFEDRDLESLGGELVGGHAASSA